MAKQNVTRIRETVQTNKIKLIQNATIQYEIFNLKKLNAKILNSVSKFEYRTFFSHEEMKKKEKKINKINDHFKGCLKIIFRKDSFPVHLQRLLK